MAPGPRALLLLAALSFAPAAALADEPPPPPSDPAPASAEPAPQPVPPSQPPVTTSLSPSPDPFRTPTEPSPARAALFEYLGGAGAAAVTVPLVLGLGSWLGTLSSNLYLAALPPLLLFLTLPPFAVVGTEWLVARRAAPNTARIRPALLVTAGVNVIGLVVGALAGVWAGDAASVSLFTLGEALLLPAAATLAMRVWRRAPPPPAAPSLAGGPARASDRALPATRVPDGVALPALVFPVAGHAF